MNASQAPDVWIATPNDADAAFAIAFLREAAISAQQASTLGALCAQLDGEVGCLILVEESLAEDGLDLFRRVLGEQPAWSDIPLLLIAGDDTSLPSLVANVFPTTGNITLLQRPLHPVSLVSAVQVALRARERQFEVRDLLSERENTLRRRDEFLAMLAHELRNPLTPVRNAVYLLNTLKIEDPVFVQARTLIDNQVAHMARLVDDLMDISRLEIGKVELRREQLNLDNAIWLAVKACESRINARKHAVVLHLAEEPLWIHADAVRLEQIISNLIGNAAKFTPPGGTITVESGKSDDRAVLTIADNGAGIAAEMLDAVFDLFRQADNSLARSAGGLGIGLTVVKRLVTLHGGTIEVQSAGLDKGSTFVLTFPLIIPKKDAPQPVSSARMATTQKKRVLLVEDNRDIRESLSMMIRMWNHGIQSAETGLDGVNRALEYQPDVALVDVGLPGLDGYGVARQIRDQGGAWGRKVKLVCMTGYGQSADREKAMRAGFDLHLLKPVDPDALRDILDANDR